MCVDPVTLAIGAAVSTAGAYAQSRAQQSALDAQGRIADEQNRLSAEQFDYRQNLLGDALTRDLDLERQGFDTIDEATANYNARVGDILETEFNRQQQSAAARGDLVGSGIGGADVRMFDAERLRFADALDQQVANTVAESGSGASFIAPGASEATRNELARQEALAKSKALAEASAGSRVMGYGAAAQAGERNVQGIGDALFAEEQKFNIGSAVAPESLRTAEAELGQVQPFADYISKSRGLLQGRTGGSLNASMGYESGMADLAMQRAGQISNRGMIGTLLSSVGSTIMSGTKKPGYSWNFGGANLPRVGYTAGIGTGAGGAGGVGSGRLVGGV